MNTLKLLDIGQRASEYETGLFLPSFYSGNRFFKV